MEPAPCGPPPPPQNGETSCAPSAASTPDTLQSGSAAEAFFVGSSSPRTSNVVGLPQQHTPSADTLGEQETCAVKGSAAEHSFSAVQTPEFLPLEKSQSFSAACADEKASVLTETKAVLPFSGLSAEEACAEQTSSATKRKSTRASSSPGKSPGISLMNSEARAVACTSPETEATAAKRQRRSDAGSPTCESVPQMPVEVKSSAAAACVPSSEPASQAIGEQASPLGLSPPDASTPSASFSAESGASEVEALRVLVARLQHENQLLKESLKSHNSCREAAGGGGELHSAGLPPSSETQGPLVNSTREGLAKTGEETAKSRRGRAPGAPPNSRGPHRKLQGGASTPPASGAEGSFSSNSSDSNLRRWGWCSPEEPLSSLRACCADHLLLGGECDFFGKKAGSSSECFEGAGCSTDCSGKTEPSGEGALREPLVLEWLLSLEAKVQATLKQPQQEHQEDAARADKSCVSSPQDALRGLIEEVGLSVLDVEGEETQTRSLEEDARLVEWFQRPKTAPRESRNLKSGGVAAAASANAAQNTLASSAPPVKKELTLPPSIRKSISISLSALRRGCPDRLNFLKRLRTDILQCSLNANAMELLVELVPDVSVANDKRQMWLEARDMLARCGARVLNDEEAFTQFVFEFGSLYQRLELLTFLNSKHMEAQLSSLLVQVQLKLDCLAMLRRRARRLAACVQAVFRAAAVVSGAAQRRVAESKSTACSEGKENRELSVSAEVTTSKISTSALPSGSAPRFRWPLLFQMVATHCGFSGDGSLDRTRSLLKFLAPYIGKTLDSSELTLLKRAAQKPLAAVVEQHACLVNALLLLHRAASRAKTAANEASSARLGSSEGGVDSMAERLLQCCHVRMRAPMHADGSDADTHDEEDLLLPVIVKLVKNHQGRLETLARLVAQLLREYAAFVCWMGDKETFLPVQLHTVATGNRQNEQQGAVCSLPAVLAPCLPQAPPQRGKVAAKLDAFECLSAFLEKLSHQAEPTSARTARAHLVERKSCVSSRDPSVQSFSSAISTISSSPRSSLGNRKPHHARYASAISHAAQQQDSKMRCLPSFNGGTEDTPPAQFRDLLSQASAALRPPPPKTDSATASRAPQFTGSSGLTLCAASPRAFRVLRIGAKAPHAPLEAAATPLRHVHHHSNADAYSGGPPRDTERRGCEGVVDVSVASPPGAQSAASDRAHPSADAKLNFSVIHVADNPPSSGIEEGRPRPALSVQCSSQEAGMPCASPFNKQSAGCVGNPSEFSTGSFTSVLFSSTPLSSAVRVFLEDGSLLSKEASLTECNVQLHSIVFVRLHHKGAAWAFYGKLKLRPSQITWSVGFPSYNLDTHVIRHQAPSRTKPPHFNVQDNANSAECLHITLNVSVNVKRVCFVGIYISVAVLMDSSLA
ncbi:hypothetical protein Esti_003894 [Eimeria stiedai]